MKDLSLIEALTNCTDSCGWCVQHCPDKVKYDMLVSCIRIQKEFLCISSTVNEILAGRSSSSMKKIFVLFEIIADDLHTKHLSDNQKVFNSARELENSWRLPGCSQIFMLSQSLRQVYLNEFSKVE